MNKKTRAFWLILSLLLAPNSLLAAEGLVSYEGTLQTADGALAVQGDYQMRFSIHSLQSDGEELWFETRTVGVGAGGRFRATLNLHSNPAMAEALSAANQRWFQIAVDGETLGQRQQMFALPSQAILETKVADLRRRLEVIEGRSAEHLTGDVMTTVGVDGVFSTLNEAVAWLNTVRVPVGSSLTILVSDGTYFEQGELRFGHQDGARISIVGNRGFPERVVVEFANSAGLVVADGSSVGRFSGVTLRGNGTGNHSGVSLSNGSRVLFADDLRVEGFGGSGIRVREAALLSGDNVMISGTGGHGVEVYTHSQAYLPLVSVTDSGGDCYRAEWGGTIYAPQSVAEDCALAAYQAVDGARIDAPSSSVRGATLGGYVASGDAYLKLQNSEITADLGSEAIRATYDSMVYAQDLVITGSVGASCIVAQWDSIVDVQSSTVSQCASKGLYAEWGSFIDGQGAIVSNTADNFSPEPDSTGNSNSHLRR